MSMTNTNSFLGQQRLPGAGDAFPLGNNSTALILTTVQPEAD
jgi:hypothetical protein